MNNLLNNGFVLVKSGTTTKLIKYQFKSDRVLFRFNKNKLSANPDGVNLYCKYYEAEKESTVFCKDYGEVLELLLDTELKEDIVSGQLVVKDIPFIVSMFAEGFLLNFDLGKTEQAYAIIVKDRSIFVSIGNKNAFKQNKEAEGHMEVCEDFYSALYLIHSHASGLLKEITKKPQNLH